MSVRAKRTAEIAKVASERARAPRAPDLDRCVRPHAEATAPSLAEALRIPSKRRGRASRGDVACEEEGLAA